MAEAIDTPRNGVAQALDGSRDFDFLEGLHQVRRMRRHPALTGRPDWEVFEALGSSMALPGGVGRIDELLTPGRDEDAMATLRVYDGCIRSWTLYPLGRDGTPQSPLKGSFSEGVGVFAGWTTLGCRQVRIRQTWSLLGRDLARFEQARSANGHTWEADWIMLLTRLHRHTASAASGGLQLATAWMFSDSGRT